MGSIIDRALDIINDHLKDQTSSFQVSSPLAAARSMARGGEVLQDEYPTHYLPEVGRQVMADGGMPEDAIGGALSTAQDVTSEPMSVPPVNPAALTGKGFEGRVGAPQSLSDLVGGVPDKAPWAKISDQESKQPTMKSLKEAFDTAIARHTSLPYRDRVASSKAAAEKLAPYVGIRKGGKPIPLLGKNAKLMKSEAGYKGEKPVELEDGSGVETTGLALAPAFKMGKFNTCPNSASCEEECLGKTSGNYFQLGGGKNLYDFKGPRLNGLNKTLAMMQEPEAFAIRLHDEIMSAKREAEYNGNRLGVRLNVLSDINPLIHKALIEAHPDVDFYDYTKNNSNPVAPNHHYTYSSTGVSQEGVDNPNSNWKQMRKRLDEGSNVAMAFSHKKALPEEVHDEETGKVYKVINGDSHDFRPLDKVPEGMDGVIIGLKNKDVTSKNDTAHIESDGFFVKYDPQFKKTAKGTQERDENGEPIAMNKRVTIKKQGKTMSISDNDGKKIGD
jgi:hypothetical protein